MSLKVKEILEIGQRQLEEHGIADARLDSKLLYCHLMNITTTVLLLEYQRTLPDEQCDKYFALLDRRSSGEPLQYITGTQEFMGLEFNVDKNVLIPRQDTETMVEDALDIIERNQLRGEKLPIKAKKDWDVLDLCCGSGAIGISLALLSKHTKVTCSDLSTGALGVAKSNASKLGAKVTFKEGDLLEPFMGRFKNRKFDVIISNPPYIRSEVIQTLQPEVRDHEPMMALDGGETGLDFYKKIIEDADKCLKKEGVLIMEIGHDQKEDVTGLMEDTGKFANVVCLEDLAHRDRIVCGIYSKK